MFFDVQTLEKRKIQFNHRFDSGSIDFLDPNLRQSGEMRVAGVAELVDPFGVREIRVKGSLNGELEALCARCLDPVRVPVACSFDLFYRPMAAIAREEEVSISEAETEIGFYEHGGLELADVVREQITIELPMRSVCRENCQGICPLCGKNRNRETCQCRQDFVDPRWEALGGWKA